MQELPPRGAVATAPLKSPASSAARRPALLPLGAMVAAITFGGQVQAQTAPVAASTDTLPAIDVKGKAEEPAYQAQKSTVGKGNQELRDIPQSVTVVTNQLIHDQNADTLKEALRNVSGLTFNAGEGGRIGDNINLRGFSAYGDIYLDGMRDISQYNRDTFNIDRIDVLRGSASMLFGRGSTGGVINQSSKMPFLGEKSDLDLTYGTSDYKRGTIDLNRRIGDNAAFRLNAMKTNAGTFRDGAYTDRIGVAPSFSWGIDSEDEFNVSYYHLSYRDTPDLGMPWYQNRPIHDAPGINVPVTRFFGFNSDYQNDSANILSGSWIRRFDNDTSLKTVLRVGDFKRDLWASQPILGAGALTDSTQIRRNFQARGATEKNITLQSDFTTKLETGAIKHEVLAGVELINEKIERYNYLKPTAAQIPTTTVGNPDPGQTLPPGFPASNIIDSSRVNFSANTIGLYAQDMIALTPHWKLLAGARFDSFDADYPSAGLKRKDNVWSYRTGIIYQPTDTQSYYASYGTSFNPSADTYSLDVRGSNTPPEKSRNIEIGAKWDLMGGDLMLRTAIYRSEKTNERNTDLDNPNPTQYILSGRRHTDGIEFEMAGRLTPEWEIFAGLSLMNAKIDESNTGNQGQRPGNTPKYTANLWTTYKLPGGWKIGGGFNSMGERTPVDNYTNIAPAYTQWDALVEYTYDKYTVKLNVFNLFNKKYADALYRGMYMPGTDRAAQVSLNYKF
ncbi:MAG: TonB-dependent siderophore receptor [Burkholderiaceae bacterium]